MNAPRPPSGLCRAGEAADGLLATGRPQEAVVAYQRVLADSVSSGRIDALIWRNRSWG